MEEVIQNLSQLKITKEKPRIGIIHHPFCQKHSAEKGPIPSLTSFNSQERPQRITAILNRLTNENLLAKCEVITEFEPCSEEEIILIHEKKFFDHVEGLFDKEKDDV